MRAVDRHGRPLPWYTYPCIYFLKQQSFTGRHVLEFGAGQSTYWWADIAASVIALDNNEQWFKEVRRLAPSNSTVHFVSSPNAQTCIANVRKIMASHADMRFDIIVIDGLYRAEMIDIAIPIWTEDGAIICDNSHGYGFFEGLQDKRFQRVDFYGAHPGVILSGSTSIFFRNGCFLFNNSRPIADFNELVA
jgi:predicted O-methyltransferase YrrM